MKIRELLINGLMATNLFEMAFSKKVAIDKARNLQNQLAKNLIKAVMYHNSQYFNHWCTEINAFIDDIQSNRIKSTNKPLAKSTLFEILFNEPLGTIDDVQSKMNRIYRDYTDLKIDQPSPEQISKSLSWILYNVSSDIEDEKFIDIKNYFADLKV